jgi:hypothetical protein
MERPTHCSEAVAKLKWFELRLDLSGNRLCHNHYWPLGNIARQMSRFTQRFRCKIDLGKPFAAASNWR